MQPKCLTDQADAVWEKRPPLARWSGFTLELGTAAVIRGLSLVATGHHSLQPPHDRTPEEGTNVPGALGSQETQDWAPILSKVNFENPEVVWG